MPSSSAASAGRAAERLLRAPHVPLEALDVELVGLDVDPVAAAAALDPLRAEDAPEAVDVDLERVRGGAGRVLAPDRVDQPLAGQHLVPAQQQEREQGALLGPSEPQRLARRDGFERAKDAELASSRPLQANFKHAARRCNPTTPTEGEHQ